MQIGSSNPAAAGGTVGGTTGAAAGSARALQTALDAVTDAGVPAALAFVRNADGAWQGASGTRAVAGDPARGTDRFRIGSATKPFVATTVLQLVAEHKLSLDDTVETLLPRLVPGGDKVTVRNLLQMTSGIPSYTDVLWPHDAAEEFEATRHKTWTPQELVKAAVSKQPDVAPGTTFEYSNTNYVLLGLIIEKVTHDTAEAEINKRIIAPLHLRSTSFPRDRSDESIAGPHLDGYFADAQGRPAQDFTEENVSWGWTAGAMISTTRDLATFWHALLDGRLLPAGLLDRMLDDTVPAPDLGPSVQYGLGAYATTLPCGTFYGHGGDIPGYTTRLYASRDGATEAVYAQTLFGGGTKAQAGAVQNLLLTALCPRTTSGTTTS